MCICMPYLLLLLLLLGSVARYSSAMHSAAGNVILLSCDCMCSSCQVLHGTHCIQAPLRGCQTEFRPCLHHQTADQGDPEGDDEDEAMPDEAATAAQAAALNAKLLAILPNRSDESFALSEIIPELVEAPGCSQLSEKHIEEVRNGLHAFRLSSVSQKRGTKVGSEHADLNVRQLPRQNAV